MLKCNCCVINVCKLLRARKTGWCARVIFGSITCVRRFESSCARAPFWLTFMRLLVCTLMRAYATSPLSLYDHATQSRRIGSIGVPRMSHHTLISHVMCHCEQTRLGHTPCSRAPACHVTSHLILAVSVLHHAHAVKNTKCAIKAPHCAHRPRHAYACASTSVCFHETKRMECFHLNIPLSFISPPMWDKMPLSQFSAFNVSNTKI
ncbi:hypothetical protein Hanom_Chr03g00251001 [Helianthus anomalus]